MSLASSFDFQAYGYSSDGTKVNGQSTEKHGAPYGRAGDVIGAFVDWSDLNGAARAVQRISFALNGKAFGAAFEVGTSSSSSSALDALPVPLQPHICQLAQGPLLHVRLLGASARAPLRHPVDGYSPLHAVAADDFCAFSAAVALASEGRLAAGLSDEQLMNFGLPDAHVVELYDFPSGSTGEELRSALFGQLGFGEGCHSAHAALHVRLAGEAGTALVACRRAAHASELIASAAGSGLAFGVRRLQHATATAREQLAQWRGDLVRPAADPSVARRLIHGSLHTQIPLPHLFDERNRRAAQPKRTASEPGAESTTAAGSLRERCI